MDVSKNSADFLKWQKYHYDIEKDYAQRIIKSPKGSEERRRLFAEGYHKVIKEIIGQYNPGGGQTDYVPVVVKIIQHLIKSGSSVFDLGCGGGGLVAGLIQAGYKVKGIDVSQDCIERTRQQLRSISADETCVQLIDVDDYQPPEFFDAIIMDNVIEHMVPDSIDDVLKKCYNMLNNGGYLLILTPHRFSGPHDISQCYLPMGAKADGFHLIEFSFGDLEKHLKAAGFSQVLGFPFHPRLLQGLKIIPKPSIWGANKTLFFERILEKEPWTKLLTLNRTLTRAMVGLLFPAICVGIKK